jgi:membrane-associated phospholipid phosphatase
VTGELKKRTDRERPNGLEDESFPSGHTSSSAAHTRLASRNLRSIDMSDDARLLSDVGLTALMVGTSWARIEAGWHFPSDTLFSMALGHFIASFLNDGFLGLDDGTSAIAFAPAPDGAVVQWNWKF